MKVLRLFRHSNYPVEHKMDDKVLDELVGYGQPAFSLIVSHGNRPVYFRRTSIKGEFLRSLVASIDCALTE